MQAEPGDRAPAPGALRLVQRFVNTNDLEGGPEVIPDAAALRDWLVAAELLEPRARVTAGDHTRAIALREALRDLAAANAGLPHDPAAADIGQRGRPTEPASPRSSTERTATSRPRPPASTPPSAASSPHSTRPSPRAPGRD